jgi:hypothetical protein
VVLDAQGKSSRELWSLIPKKMKGISDKALRAGSIASTCLEKRILGIGLMWGPMIIYTVSL